MVAKHLQHISATEARVRFGKYVQEIREGSEPIVVEKAGEAVLIMLSPSEFLRLSRQDMDVWRRIDSVRNDVAQRRNGRPSPDIDELIDAGRD